MTTRRVGRRLMSIGVLGGLAAGLYGLTVRGALTIDIGIGRRVRPLGSLTLRIEAPREMVYEIISAPYLGRTPRALQSKLNVLERGRDMVLAEHFTEVAGFVVTTVETVRFDRPNSVHFRLVRGPVPHVIEQFLLRETSTGTELEYSGELGTDLWGLGQWWGERVARRWETAVRASLAAVKTEAERRAQRS